MIRHINPPALQPGMRGDDDQEAGSGHLIRRGTAADGGKEGLNCQSRKVITRDPEHPRPKNWRQEDEPSSSSPIFSSFQNTYSDTIPNVVFVQISNCSSLPLHLPLTSTRAYQVSSLSSLPDTLFEPLDDPLIIQILVPIVV